MKKLTAEEYEIYKLIRTYGIEVLKDFEPDCFEPNSVKFKTVKNSVWLIFDDYEKNFASEKLLDTITNLPEIQRSRSVMIDQYALFKKIVREKQTELADLKAHFYNAFGSGSSKQNAIVDARKIKNEISRKFHHGKFGPKNELGKQ